MSHLQTGNFDAYEANLTIYAEEIDAALGENPTASQVAELARIDNEAALELNRLKDEVVSRLAALARRSQASSAYLTPPPSAGPSAARSA